MAYLRIVLQHRSRFLARATRGVRCARAMRIREAQADHEPRVLEVTELRRQNVTVASSRIANLNGHSGPEQAAESLESPRPDEEPEDHELSLDDSTIVFIGNLKRTRAERAKQPIAIPGLI